MPPEGKYLVIRRDGSIPSWPCFVLGGRDPYVPAALEAYAKAVRDTGGNEEYAQLVEQRATDFRLYAQSVGYSRPEEPNQFIEHEGVARAMRAEVEVIQLTVMSDAAMERRQQHAYSDTATLRFVAPDKPSSNVKEIGHKDGNLYIRFQDGSLYMWKGASAHHESLRTSLSPGKFVHEVLGKGTKVD